MKRIALVFLMVLALVGVAAGNGPVLRYSVRVSNPFTGSSGSGVVVAQGILTAYHVVDLDDGALAPVVVCETMGGEPMQAYLIRVDSQLDLALLSVDRSDLPAVELGPEPALGDPVWVVGCGFSVPHSVKRGVVANRLPGELLVDAMVVPGDSGCAVMDDQGRLVGMVRALYHQGEVSGYGSAVDLATLRGFLGN